MPGKPMMTVVDLDGTYVRGNTLHIYIRCGMAQMLRRLSFGKLMRTIGLLALRRLHLVSHKAMKFGICAMVDPTDMRLRCEFKTRVERLINADVRKALDKADELLLATAAPDTYVPWIWDGAYVATAMEDNPERIECRGEEKLRRIEKYVEYPALPGTLYTDHSDDIPLMKLHWEEVVLVSPSVETVRKVDGLGIRYRVIN